MNGIAMLRPRASWFSAPNLFAAGLFCLVTGVGFGAKPIAAGQVFLVAAFLKAFLERGRSTFSSKPWRPSAWCLAAFLLVSLLSILANLEVVANPWEHLGKLRYPAFVLLLSGMPWLVREVLPQPWRRDTLVLAWFVPLALAIVAGLSGWWTGHHPVLGEGVVDIRRVSGLYGQVMTFAYSLQFTVILLATFTLLPRQWGTVTRLPWWMVLVMLALGGGALYLTYTRGAMLGAATGFAVIATMRSWKLSLLVVGIAVAGALVARADGARYLDTKIDIRGNQWKAAALSFLERPVFGWGYRNFELHSAEIKERYSFEKDVVRKRGQPKQVIYFQGHAHNNYLEAFASTGFAGGIAFLAFCLCWLREARRHPHPLFFVPGVCAFLVSGCFENTFFDSEVLNCLLLFYLFIQWTGEEGCRESNTLTDPRQALPSEPSA